MRRRRGRARGVALRVIPDVDAETHRHLTTGLAGGKFGIPMREARGLARRAADWAGLEFVGLSCHLGSQIREAGIFGAAAKRMAELRADLEGDGVGVLQVDMGGGFAAADAAGGVGCDFDACAAAMFSHLDGGRTRVLVEPGRSVVAAAGVLLTRVEYVKRTGGARVIVADAGMNDLLRPALYEARHRIVRVAEGEGSGEAEGGEVMVAGPVCESADVLGCERGLVAAEGDLLAVLDAGAYGMTMSSNYNARLRPCEVLAEGGDVRLIRRRETMDDLLNAERWLD